MTEINWIGQAAGASEIHGPSWEWFWDKLAPPLATGLLIALIGSFLLPRWNERFKGQRDHLNQAVSDLRSQLATLQRTAASYWSKRGKHPAEEAEIEYLIQDVASLFDACAIGGSVNERTDLIAHLAAEIVTADFGTSKRPAEPDRARLIATLSAEIARVASADRRQYFHKTWIARACARAWHGISRRFKGPSR